MDTKWKNRSKWVVWIMLLTFGLSGIVSILENGHWYFKKDYFHTEEFNEHFEEFIDYLSISEINYLSEDELKDNIKVSKEEIEEHRTRYGSLSEQIADIKSQYEYQIDEAKAAKNEDVVKLYEQQRDAKVKDIMENFRSDEHIKAKILKEKEKEVEALVEERQSYIADYDPNLLGFNYYLVDMNSKDVYTNVPTADTAKDLKDRSNLFSKEYSSSSENGNLSSSGHDSFMQYSNYEYLPQKSKTLQGFITLPEGGSWLQKQVFDFEKRQTVFYIISICSIVILFIVFIWGRRLHPLQLITSSDKVNIYRKVPIDIRWGILLISTFFAIMALVMNAQNYDHMAFSILYSDGIFEFLITTLMVAITLIQVAWIYGDVSKKHLYKDAFIMKSARWFYRLVSDAFYNRSVGIQIMLLLIVIFLSGFGAAVVFFHPMAFVVYFILFLFFTVPVMIYLFKRIGFFNRIIQHTNELAAGQMEQDLPHKGKSALAMLAGNLNLLKHGVKTSKRAEAKSERLKTELITNVSHDLRTPLTSIITYTELLRSQEVTKEDQNAYLEIIDRKSKRLKVLIDDLFEVSKMASGNLELIKHKVDIVQLLQQAMAEYSETIKESSLTFRVATPNSPIFANVDGQKMWRVFENLIGNALKYSMDNTRVYISVTEENLKVVVSFKNVSKYELGGNFEELFERFKRGDTSRHTDGSGLGLAIAKSIVDLHDGSMEIDVDGDLFKATIELDAVK
ncbi:histidine kinase dimerization/phospho-acceptor domain-containing protein [Fictibacillus nanhaiensis]|uniref:histidine kinase dimerization/phospho-acceptor domain-containing protein n=1 Tax=Fictibacillus nanhaiensis TaxID=742169 RepID=UPI002E22771D|nr:histidine kinase dimerization/phospho-acceptor domain-containing protein [Fictibacillus nanhaiensis]MED1864378.1 histidine kinase dimerization/phospho-acceptor domain-containing protein [Fictibacillus nanhaiensis]